MGIALGLGSRGPWYDFTLEKLKIFADSIGLSTPSEKILADRPKDPTCLCHDLSIYQGAHTIPSRYAELTEDFDT